MKLVLLDFNVLPHRLWL